jgi:hypothetical protein
MLYRLKSHEDNWKCWMLLCSGEDVMVKKEDTLMKFLSCDVQIGESPIDAVSHLVSETTGLKLYDITLLDTIPVDGASWFIFISRRYEGDLKTYPENYDNFKWIYAGYLQNYGMDTESRKVLDVYYSKVMR